MIARITSALLIVSGAAVLYGQPAPTALAGSNVRWTLDPNSAKVDTHLGRPSIFLRAQNPPAFVADLEFVDGTIEFDLAALPGGNFVGLVFRYANETQHENLYFRLHRSGSFEALQYAPRIYTTAGIWQLTPEFMAPVVYTPGAWVHIRAEVTGSRLEMFVGDSAKPVIVVPRMRGVTSRGRVGIWGRVNDRPEEWTAAISNIRITPRAAVPVAVVDTSQLAPGTLTGWMSAGPFAAQDSASPPPIPTTGWKPLPIEEHGLLNISRQYAKPPGGRHVAFLKNVIRSAAAVTVQLQVSYSDDAMFWLNGTPVYRGSNGFNGRYSGYLGFAGVPSETIYLPLRAGENELIAAVGERQFGWGLRARLVR
jgi:hypothetical protein